MTDARAWLDQVDARTTAATDDVRFGVLVQQARTDLPAATTALRAVLDLHADDGYGDCTECGVDSYENPIAYPCLTVTAITTAIEEDA